MSGSTPLRKFPIGKIPIGIPIGKIPIGILSEILIGIFPIEIFPIGIPIGIRCTYYSDAFIFGFCCHETKYIF